MMRKFFETAVLIVSSSLPAIAGDFAGPAKIIDGDTIKVGLISIRLHGIDAPEVGQRCKMSNGKNWDCDDAAMDRLGDLIANGVVCKGKKYDGYDRLLAVCFTPSGTDINKTLVAEGYAWAFRKYSIDYVSDEVSARGQRLGVWQAETQAPWDYRDMKWQVAAQEAPKGCPIKGNISSNGNIYHAPWSPWYKRTKVSVDKGERWFCSEREALDAGWRAPAWR
ncbi:thermonuclease family protein [Aminobacter sp. LjRoot7]|uniref:thermonuclease family protein n=1 Tax=Aminobacter sp. LjRoot7 TaxID=3342335 RepID=UPI003A7ACAB0